MRQRSIFTTHSPGPSGLLDRTLENHMQVSQIRMCICIFVFVSVYTQIHLYLSICTTHSPGQSGLLDQTSENHTQVSQIRLCLSLKFGEQAMIIMSADQIRPHFYSQKIWHTRKFCHLSSWKLETCKREKVRTMAHPYSAIQSACQKSCYYHVDAWSLVHSREVKKTTSHNHHVGSSVLATQRPLNP